MKQEIEILTRLHHPNIVDLKEVTASKDKIYMIMELVPGGELFDHIIANGPLQVWPCHSKRQEYGILFW